MLTVFSQNARLCWRFPVTQPSKFNYPERSLAPKTQSQAPTSPSGSLQEAWAASVLGSAHSLSGFFSSLSD